MFLKSDRPASESPDEDTHATMAPKQEVCRLLLDVVVLERTAILELLTNKDQTLLV